MRLVHRQRTGLFRHLPVFFVAMGVLGWGWGAAAAAPASTSEATVTATDGSEDPEVLIRMYLEWMLRQMRAPVPAKASLDTLARAVVLEYQRSGTPELKSLEVLVFVDAIVSTQALLAANPDLLSPSDAARLNQAFEGMLADLIAEGRVES